MKRIRSLQRIIGANFCMCQGASESSLPTKKSQVIEFNSQQNWRIKSEDLKANSNLIVINFTASWCGPCRSMELSIDQFADTYKEVKFVKVDVENLKDVADEYGVQATPTFIFLKRGKEVDKIVGARKDELENMIKKHKDSSSVES